ncbi:MAG: vitamin B12-dependent ribonucleotide reductase [Bacteroidetes bacterium]|nr:MAG: vitamin B12-dependent ribonucleotide reductase [Bacteroidota bacterium]
MKKQRNRKQAEEKYKALKIERYFTDNSLSPYEQFTFELRKSCIRGPKGEVVFDMDNVEVPSAWSQVATDVLAQKYFRKTGVPMNDGSTGSETSLKQVVHRMVSCWTEWANRYGYFESKNDSQAFYDELAFMLLGQYAAPNSPQWFNTGLYSVYGIKGKGQGHYYVDPQTEAVKLSDSAYERPQPHACFILSVKDDLVNEGGIMDLWLREARIFKYGSGVGTNFSNIRGVNEKLSGGGYSSGLMSFLKIGDRAAGAIKSGGTTRRAAKMVCLDMDHPEIESFIQWKMNEELKAAALIAAGYERDYEGEAYNTISGQNSNNSVRVPDAFMEALGKNHYWDLVSRTDGSVVKSVKAVKLWNEIAEAAWRCADPGLQFDTTINDWHTCPESGPIRASNPCSEYMFLDDTACNLASLNLEKFFDLENGELNIPAFRHACRLWTIVLEVSVLMAQFPSSDVARLSYEYRTLGLGFAGLGSVLMRSGIPYDSDKGRAIASAVSAIMTGSAYSASAEMARYFGPFKGYHKNKSSMLRVIRNHRYAAYHAADAYENLHVKPEGLDAANCPDYLLKAACESWDLALRLGEQYGYRNAQVSVIAPTGTIGLVMDCDTTGVEPDFALVKFKKLSGGGYFKIVNQSVPHALKFLGYSKSEIREMIDFVRGSGSFKNAPFINVETLRSKGFTDDDLKKLDELASSAFDIRFLFNEQVLGKNCVERTGISQKASGSSSEGLLEFMGFTTSQIEEANHFVCGNMTLEGAPHLNDAHLAVFDCANKCGTGSRFIHPFGHIKMMAAVQPFISGAISKTINLPNEATVEDIMSCYALSWEKGLKAIALYRDGSKFSQPLSSKKSEMKKTHTENIAALPDELTADQVLDAAKRLISLSSDTKFKRQLSNIVHRKRLPEKRQGFTQKSKVGGHTIFVRTGEYDDGTLGEIFIDMHKEGASFRSLLNCFAISVSIGLQYGVPLEEFVEKFIFTRFDPSGPVEHPNIKSSTSVIDFIFRLLALEYLSRTDLVQVPPVKAEGESREVKSSKPQMNIPQPEEMQTGAMQSQYHLSSMMGDAPVCHSCGHITIRSGSCYKCLNCGSSLGCS